MPEALRRVRTMTRVPMTCVQHDFQHNGDHEDKYIGVFVDSADDKFLVEISPYGAHVSVWRGEWTPVSRLIEAARPRPNGGELLIDQVLAEREALLSIAMKVTANASTEVGVITMSPVKVMRLEQLEVDPKPPEGEDLSVCIPLEGTVPVVDES